jgi:hypothetical protein
VFQVPLGYKSEESAANSNVQTVLPFFVSNLRAKNGSTAAHKSSMRIAVVSNNFPKGVQNVDSGAKYCTL